MDKDIGSYTLSVGAHQSRFALLQRAETEGTLKPRIEVEIAGCYEFILCGEVVLGSPIVAVMVIARCLQVPGGPNGVLPCQAVVVPSLRPATRHARQYRRLKGHYLRRSNRNPGSLFCWTAETPNHAISTRTAEESWVTSRDQE